MMSKRISALITALLAIFIITYDGYALQLEITFPLDDFVLTSAQSFVHTEYTGEGVWLPNTDPPMVAVNILMPPGEKANAVSSVVWENSHTVGDASLAVLIDDTLGNDVSYKAARQNEYRCTLIRTGFLRGRGIATIGVAPFQYKNGILSLAEKISLNIQTEFTKNPIPERETMWSARMERNIIATSVINPDMENRYTPDVIAETDMPPYSARSLPPLSGDDPMDFLILTADSLADACNSFLEENLTGVRSAVYTMEEIGEFYYAEDEAAALRNFLKDAYSHWGISGILIVGDYHIMPVRYLDVRFVYQLERVPTDLYYLSLDGTMNYDGDYLYGDSNEDDLYPELFGGRLPFDTPEQISDYLSKLYLYRYAPPTGYTTDWLFCGASLTHTGEDQMGQSAKEGIISDSLVPLGIDITRMYARALETGGDIELTKDNFISALNDGVYFVNSVDHGDKYVFWTGYTTGGNGLFISDMNALRNAPYFPLLYSFSCDINSLDHDNVSQHWLDNPLGGGIVMLGNTAVAWSSQVNMDRHFFEQVSLFPAGTPIGVVHEAQIADMIALPYSSALIELMGYPLIRLRYTEPRDLAISYDTIHRGDGSVVITVRDSFTSAPVSDATVVVSTIDYHFVRGETGTDGVVELPLVHIIADTLLVAANKSGFYAAKVETVYVSRGSAAILSAENIVFVEDAVEDSLAEAGESGHLMVNIANRCDVSSSATEVFLAIPDWDFVSDTLTVPALDAGASLSLDFSGVTIPMWIEEGISNLRPTLHWFGSDIIDTLSLSVYAPEPFVAGMSYIDGEDNVFAPGEEGVIRLLVENGSLAEIMNASCLIGDHSSPVFFVAETLDVSSLSYRDTVEYTIGVFTPATHTGNVLFTLLVSDYLGREWTFPLTLRALSYPDSITVNPGFDRIELVWKQPVGSIPVMGYYVYRSDEEWGAYERLAPIPVWSSRYMDTGLRERSVFYYRVSTVDSSMNESPLSPPIKGWTSLAYLNNFPVEIRTGVRFYATAAVSDIDGDGVGEIFCAGWDGALYGFHFDGRDINDSSSVTADPFATIVSYTGSPLSIGAIWGSPAIGDVDGDGEPEILVAARSDYGVYLWDTEGNEKPGWHQVAPSITFSTPVMADLDNDGRLEIIVNLQMGMLCIWRYDGTPYIGTSCIVDSMSDCTGYMGFSSPAVGDLNGDGYKEIVVGGLFDLDTDTLGLVYCFEHDGTRSSGWPVHLPGKFGSDPAIANIDDDPSTQEVVINAAGVGVYVIRQDGTVLDGFPYRMTTELYHPSSPAVADFDGDGRAEIAVKGYDDLVLLSPDGVPMPGFPIPAGGEQNASPIIADIDGDGSLDILTSVGPELFAYDMHGQLIPGFPVTTGFDLYASATVWDINNDGDYELILPSYDSKLYIWSTGAPASASAIPWYTKRGNFQRTGNLADTLMLSVWGNGASSLLPVLSLSAHPNPFNDVCQIVVNDVPAGISAVTFHIYDIGGRCVADFVAEPRGGCVAVNWNAGGIPTGAYLLRVAIDNAILAKRIIYLK